MTADPRALRRATIYGASALLSLPAGLLGLNKLLAPLEANQVAPIFDHHEPTPGADPNGPSVCYEPAPDASLMWRFSCFLGMSNNRLQIKPLLPFMQTRGDAIVATNGTSVMATPAAMDTYVQTLPNEPQRKEVVIGPSLGSHLAFSYLVLRHLAGRPVKHAIFIGGPPRPQDANWPHWCLPLLAPHLPGPLAKPIWEAYWHGRLRRAEAEDKAAGTTHRTAGAQRGLDMHHHTWLSGAAQLARGLDLSAATMLTGTRVLVIMQHPDPQVHPSAVDGWKQAFPDCTVATIKRPGHIDFGLYPCLYMRAIRPWLDAV